MVLVDREGFLQDYLSWNQEIAVELAQSADIKLSEEHWEVLYLVRDYYDQYRLFPPNRILVKKMGETLGKRKGTSIHLMTLFTGKPAKMIAKLAGLPKPPNCD